MASLQTVVELIFQGVDNASDTANGLVKSLNDMNQAASDIAAPFSDMAENLAVVQGALLAVAGVIGTLAYKESVDFEASLLDLQKQMEANEGTAQAFSGVLEALAVKYGINANELVKSAADFKAAGYDLDTSTKLVEQSLQLLIAGGVDASAAVDIMNKSLAGFQVPAADVVREAQHIGDVLNKTADLTKSSFTELATGFSALSPIAKQTGLSFEETAALLSKVIDVFGSGSEAANGLKSGFLSLVDPSKEAAATLQTLGIRFDEAGKPIGTVKEILATLAPAFNQLDESQKLAAASTIFGKDQAAKLVQVLVNYQDAMKLSAQVTQEAAGSIQKEVEIRLGSAQAVINSTNEAWRQFLRALGDQFQLDTTGVIKSLGDLGLSFKQVIESGALDPLFDQLRPQLQNLEELLRTVAKNLPAAFEGIDFSALTRALENLGIEAKGALEALLGPIDLSTVEGLRDAIQRVIDVLAGLVNVTAGELGGLKPFLAGIRELTEAFRDAQPEAQGYLGTLLGFSTGFQAFSGILDGVNTALLGLIAFGGKLAPLAAEAGLLAAGMTGPQGIAVALGAAAVAIVTFLVPAEQLADYAWPDWLAGYEGATPGTAAADIAEGFAALTDRIKGWMGIVDQADTKQQGFNETLEKPVPVTQYDGLVSAIARYEAEIKKNEETYNHWFDLVTERVPVDQYDGMISRLDELAGAQQTAADKAAAAKQGIEKVTAASNELVPKLITVRDANGQIVQTYTEMVPAGEKMAGTFSVIGKGIEDTATAGQKAEKALKDMADGGKLTVDQLLEITKTANDFQIKMEEIASNERIKLIEAKVNLDIAQLESDTKKVEAAFESINTTIQSTGEVLGELYGQYGSAGDNWDKRKFEGWIEDENERRDKAMEMQNELIQSQIDQMKARTDAMNRGDAMITVNGDGLAPHLEAFMWEVLKAIQVRASADMQEFLLGV